MWSSPTIRGPFDGAFRLSRLPFYPDNSSCFQRLVGWCGVGSRSAAYLTFGPGLEDGHQPAWRKEDKVIASEAGEITHRWRNRTRQRFEHQVQEVQVREIAQLDRNRTRQTDSRVMVLVILGKSPSPSRHLTRQRGGWVSQQPSPTGNGFTLKLNPSFEVSNSSPVATPKVCVAPAAVPSVTSNLKPISYGKPSAGIVVPQ